MRLLSYILNTLSFVTILGSCYYINGPYVWFTDMILLGVIAVNAYFLITNNGSSLLYINSALVLLAVICAVIVNEEPDEFCYLRAGKLLGITATGSCSTLHMVDNLFGITLLLVIVTELMLLYQVFKQKTLFKV